ncbi:lipase 3-like [Leptidea sinapis]|uniref:lipase 3-like n=1 Tax=Leptidea sinapis TaxID=189913 RepID=UPI002135729C|nr:lipase 3-like [Leptidea sinapis]
MEAMFNVIILMAAIILRQPNSVLSNVIEERVLSSGNRINFTELASLYGLKANEYNVTTEDGYILGLFHIPGSNHSRPVLLIHGIDLSSDCYLIRGDNSLGITLARRGFDLWFANLRGNIYSRRNIYLNPDTDPEFWNFSFNENGIYDLPAIIDIVMNKTKAPKLNVIGHSQGNTGMLVLGAKRPEYNEKINKLIYLAPVSYLSHVSPVLSAFISISPLLNLIGEAAGLNEFLGYNQRLTKLYRAVCTSPVSAYAICANLITFPVVGFDPTELGPTFYRVTNYYFPVGGSRKSLIHYAQIGIRGVFAEYDYGAVKNVAVYNSSLPPVYNLSRVDFPSVLLVGNNDGVASVKDAERLRDELPNVESFRILPRKKMTHLDFIVGRTMEKYLFPYIIEALN